MKKSKSLDAPYENFPLDTWVEYKAYKIYYCSTFKRWRADYKTLENQWCDVANDVKTFAKLKEAMDKHDVTLGTDKARLAECAKLITDKIKVAGENELLAVDSGKKAIDAAIEAGNLLIEAKRLAGHGNFEKWVADNIGKSQDTVERYMNLAKSAPMRDLSGCETLNQAYTAIKTPLEKVVGGSTKTNSCQPKKELNDFTRIPQDFRKKCWNNLFSPATRQG